MNNLLYKTLCLHFFCKELFVGRMVVDTDHVYSPTAPPVPRRDTAAQTLLLCSPPLGPEDTHQPPFPWKKKLNKRSCTKDVCCRCLCKKKMLQRKKKCLMWVCIHAVFLLVSTYLYRCLYFSLSFVLECLEQSSEEREACISARQSLMIVDWHVHESNP